MSLYTQVKQFCERHIIADDPYQYETYMTDQLVAAAFIFKTGKDRAKPFPKVLRNEMVKRLNNPPLPLDERVLMLKTLERT